MNKHETHKKTASIIQGKIAIVHKGIEYCKSELAHACKSFALCIDKTTQDVTDHYHPERILYGGANNIAEEDVIEELTTPPSSDDCISEDDDSE